MKQYEDPSCDLINPVSVEYAVFSSEWDIEELKYDNGLKIIHRKSGDSISLGFTTLKDRVEFTKKIFASKKVKQIGGGMNLEQFANTRIKPAPMQSESVIINSIKGLFRKALDFRVFGIETVSLKRRNVSLKHRNGIKMITETENLQG